MHTKSKTIINPFLILNVVFGLSLITACHSRAQENDNRNKGYSITINTRSQCLSLADKFGDQLRLTALPDDAQRETDFNNRYDSKTHACYLEKNEEVQTDFLRQRSREVFNAQNQTMIVGCFQSSYYGPPASVSCRSGLTGHPLNPADAKQTLDTLMAKSGRWPIVMPSHDGGANKVVKLRR